MEITKFYGILYKVYIEKENHKRKPNFKGGMTYDSIKAECNNGTGKDTRR